MSVPKLYLFDFVHILEFLMLWILISHFHCTIVFMIKAQIQLCYLVLIVWLLLVICSTA
jgi:hypothetical protein